MVNNEKKLDGKIVFFLPNWLKHSFFHEIYQNKLFCFLILLTHVLTRAFLLANNDRSISVKCNVDDPDKGDHMETMRFVSGQSWVTSFFHNPILCFKLSSFSLTRSQPKFNQIEVKLLKSLLNSSLIILSFIY